MFKASEYSLYERVYVFGGKRLIFARFEGNTVSHTLFTVFNLRTRIHVEQFHLFYRAFRRLFYGGCDFVAGEIFVADEREISFNAREFRQRGKSEYFIEFIRKFIVVDFGDVNFTFQIVVRRDFVANLTVAADFFSVEYYFSGNSGVQISLFGAFRQVEFKPEIVRYPLYRSF